MIRGKVIAGTAVAVMAAALLGGAGVWYFLLRSDAPPPVSLAEALEAAGTPGAPATDGLAGEWRVVQGGASFVGYRVQEELVNVGATTAVGRTERVEGTLTFDGRAVTRAEITADLRALTSDRPLRDNALRTQALETNRYPTATFVLTRPVEVARVPGEGETVTQTVVGQLTLHGVTREVQVEVQAVLQGGRLAVVGSTEIRFADFNIAQPRAASVLSVADRGTMELQLIFEKAG